MTIKELLNYAKSIGLDENAEISIPVSNSNGFDQFYIDSLGYSEPTKEIENGEILLITELFKES